MKRANRMILMALGALFAGGCATIVTPVDDGYRFGDTTRTYCETTDPAIREAGRRLAAGAGLTLFDICGAYDYVGQRGES